MAQTFNDFMLECATYEYSKENYELMKECSELVLMEQYIENQRFYVENVAELTTEATFTEGYFAESVSDEKIQAITESFGEKIGKAADTIIKGIKNLIARIVKFFRSLSAKFSNTSKEGIELYKKLKEAKISAAQYEELGKKLASVCRSTGLTIYNQQNFTVELGVGGAVATKYLRYYQVAFADKTVKLGLEDSDDCVDGEVLAKILGRFVKAKKGYDFDSTMKLIESAKETGKKEGVIVYANDKVLEKVNTKLGECEKLCEYLEKVQLEKAQDVSKMREAWAKINAVVAATMRQYGGYAKYRQRSHQTIKEFLNGAAAAEKPADEKK